MQNLKSAKLWLTLIQTLLLLFGLAFFYYSLKAGLATHPDLFQRTFKHTVVISSLGWVGLVLSMLGGWIFMLKCLEAPKIPFSDLCAVFASGWVARYIPGKFASVFGKVAVGSRYGLPASVSFKASIFEQAIFLISALLVSLAAGSTTWASLIEGANIDWLAVVMFTFGTCIAAALIAISTRARWQNHNIKMLSFRHAACGIIIYIFPHVFAGCGLYWAFRLIEIDVAPPIFFTVGLLALAHLGGSLAFFAPTGIGVREAILAAGFVQFMSIESAVVYAVVARIWATVGDGLAIIGLLIIVAKGRLVRKSS